MHNSLSIRNVIITLTKNLPHLPISPSPYLPTLPSLSRFPIPDSRFPIPSVNQKKSDPT
ncbi:hypothetical protein [Moorena sp. SIO2C4]|uniref:hypothetical protein n=1 Tax=Moorena sp. SIO2C4 TaxID=2607824 RepID=UPI0013CAC22C|nr:hypothetical protein [Moorena sp. SIO2C4]NES45106.1 hypothetical protein [Moorena sp. SIO2C4]